jgi:hypothetical protein
MAKEKYYRYYIEPLNIHTNKVLAEELGSQYECAPRLLWSGKKRPAWETPEYFLVAFLQRSHNEEGLKFKAYIQEGNRPLRPCPFDATKKELRK